MGKYLKKVAESGDGATASLIGYFKYLTKATAKTIVLKTATVALNTAISAGASFLASFAIDWLVGKIIDWINAEDNAREATAKLIEEASQANEEFDRQQENINNLFDKYTKLEISTKDMSEKSSDLKDVQNELTEAFKGQAKQLDVLNKKYEENLKLKIQQDKKETEDFLNEYKGSFDKASDINDSKKLNSEWHKEEDSLDDSYPWYTYNSTSFAVDRSRLDDRKDEINELAASVDNLDDSVIKTAKDTAESFENIDLEVDGNRIRVFGTIEDQLKFFKAFKTNANLVKGISSENQDGIKTELERLEDLNELYNNYIEKQKKVNDLKDSAPDEIASQISTAKDIYDELQNATSSGEKYNLSTQFTEIKDKIYNTFGDNQTIKEYADNFFGAIDDAVLEAKNKIDTTSAQYVETLNDFKEKTYKTTTQGIEKFNSAFEKITNDKTLSGDEITELINLNNELAGSFTKTVDGYTINTEKLEQAKKSYAKAVQDQVKTEIANNEEAAQKYHDTWLIQKADLDAKKEKLAELRNQLSQMSDSRKSSELKEEIGYIQNDIKESETSVNQVWTDYQKVVNLAKQWNDYQSDVNDRLSNTQQILAKKKVTDLETQPIKEVEYKINAINREITAENKVKDSLEKQKDTLNEQLNTLKKQQDKLKEIIANYETAASTVQKLVDNQVKGIEKQKTVYEELRKEERKAIEDKKTALEKEKESVEFNYENRIGNLKTTLEMLERQNDKIKEYITLQEKANNLINARNQKVRTFSSASGWQIETDAESVNKAKQEYDEELRNRAITKYNNKISDLESEKSDKSDWYSERIKNVETSLTKFDETTNKQTEIFEKRIEEWNEYKEKWQEAVDSYKNAQDEHTADLILGSNWREQIANKDTGVINQFEADYQTYQKQLNVDVAGEVTAVENEIAAIENAIDAVNKNIQNKQDQITSWNNTKTAMQDFINACKTKGIEHADNLAGYNSQIQGLCGDQLSYVQKWATEYQNAFNKAYGSEDSEGVKRSFKQWIVRAESGTEMARFATAEQAGAYANQLHGAVVTANIKKLGSSATQRDIENAYKKAPNYTWSLEEVGSYANGGVIDRTGFAKVHGDRLHSEVVFNSAQAKKLYEAINNSQNIAKMVSDNITKEFMKSSLSNNIVNNKALTNDVTVRIEIGSIEANNPEQLFGQIEQYVKQANLQRMIGL